MKRRERKKEAGSSAGIEEPAVKVIGVPSDAEENVGSLTSYETSAV